MRCSSVSRPISSSSRLGTLWATTASDVCSGERVHLAALWPSRGQTSSMSKADESSHCTSSSIRHRADGHFLRKHDGALAPVDSPAAPVRSAVPVAGRRDVRLVVPIRRPREAVPASGAVSHFVVEPSIAAPGRCGKQGRQVMLSSLPTARAYRAGRRQEPTNSHADREPSIDAAGGLMTFRPLGGHPFPLLPLARLI
jgi:hypothetical protein